MKKKIIFIIFYIFIFNISSSKNINADDLFEKGKLIFLGDGNCATCHTLEDANSYGNIGPNLNEIKADISRVLMAVTNGIGVMQLIKDSCQLRRLMQLQLMLLKVLIDYFIKTKSSNFFNLLLSFIKF